MADLRAAILERADQLEALARATIDARGCGHGHWAAVGLPHERRVVDTIGRPVAVDTFNGRSISPADAEHIATWDPQAVLTLCAGTRKLAELHRPDDIIGVHCETCQVAYQCQTIREVARMLGIDPDSGQT